MRRMQLSSQTTALHFCLIALAVYQINRSIVISHMYTAPVMVIVCACTNPSQ
jgi:hypothetical protein